MYMTFVAGSPCAKTVSFGSNLAIFVPSPAEPRNNFASNAGIRGSAFLGERRTAGDTRRTAESAIRQNSTGANSAGCSILHTSCQATSAPLARRDTPTNPWNSLAYKQLGALKSSPQRPVYFQAPIVVNESFLSEAVHEQIDSRARRADHFRQYLVA